MFHVKQWEHELAEFEAWVDGIWEKALGLWGEDHAYREPRRARRIRDKERMKMRARWIACWGWGHGLLLDYSTRWHDWSKGGDFKVYEKNADHLAVCSCWMCGHKRRHNGPNMQELREIGRADSDMKNYCAGQYWRL